MKINQYSNKLFIENTPDHLIVRNFLYKELLTKLLRKNNAIVSKSFLSFEGNVQHLHLDVYFGNKIVRKIKTRLRRSKRSIRKVGGKNFRLLKRYLTVLKRFKKRRYKGKKNNFQKKEALIKVKRILSLYPKENLKKLGVATAKNLLKKHYGYIRKKKQVQFSRLKTTVKNCIKYYLDLKKELKSSGRYLKFRSHYVNKSKFKNNQNALFLTKLEPNLTKDLHVRINSVNKYLDKKYIFARLLKELFRFKSVLFQRGDTLFNDFVAICSLFARKQISVDSFCFILTEVFKSLHKHKHRLFFGFVRRLAELFTSLKTTKIKGMKIQVSGRLSAKDKASSMSAFSGNVGLTTISAETVFGQRHMFTIYGIFGLKVWVTYDKTVRLTREDVATVIAQKMATNPFHQHLRDQLYKVQNAEKSGDTKVSKWIARSLKKYMIKRKFDKFAFKKKGKFNKFGKFKKFGSQKFSKFNYDNKNFTSNLNFFRKSENINFVKSKFNRYIKPEIVSVGQKNYSSLYAKYVSSMNPNFKGNMDKFDPYFKLKKKFNFNQEKVQELINNGEIPYVDTSKNNDSFLKQRDNNNFTNKKVKSFDKKDNK